MNKIIGEPGSSRTTYQHENPDWVIKKPNTTSHRHKNLQEWKTWQLAVEKGIEELLVPCVKCAPDGDWLIMERAELLEDKRERPPKLPWMHDAGWKNWGVHNGRKKLLDYASSEIYKRLKQL